MAEIWLARSAGAHGFEKQIIIKRILPELRDKPRYRDLFVQEARLCAGLSHPNIVSVFDLGVVTAQGQAEPYMAMEHIHGRDLLRVLRALRARAEGTRAEGTRAEETRAEETIVRGMPPELAATVAAGVASGLAYAHRWQDAEGRLTPVLHRDVSPHNILIGFEGEIKLVDFGIAQAGEAAAPGGGKQAYMAPEQQGGEAGAAGTAADVYALGVVLFELLAGRRLFPDREDAPDRRALPDLGALLPEVPEALRAVLAMALQPDPAARPTAAAWEAQLRRFLFEAGHHSNARALAQMMQRLFAEELAQSPGRAGLQRLAQDLDDLHTGLQPSPPPQTPASAGRSPVRGAGRGERRTVALVAAELSGLTDLSARLDAEELTRQNFRLLRPIWRAVGELGGSILRYEDGQLLVGFGLERAHADDAERALCCARDLLRLCQRLRRRQAVEVSLGVHVGEVMIGPRRGRRWRILPSGDTQRLCLQLAALADPGTILASDRVVGLVGDRFPFDRGPEVRRKGSSRRSPAFRLLGGRRSPGVWGGGRWHRRGEEWEVLRDCVAALGQPGATPGGSAGASGARVLVRGEAGSGKSRLFREMRELALRREIPAFLGRALPFGGDRPFALFRDLLSDVLGLRGDLAEAEIGARVERLSDLGLGPAEIGMLRALYGLRGANQPGPEPPRDVMFAAAALLVRGLCADRPAILLLEDVHLLQGAERALLTQMIQAAEGEPLLVLMSSRVPIPGLRARELVLPALPPAQVLALAAEILGADSTGPDLSRLLQRTAEGNPLYVAEILKALHRQGRIWFEGRTARLKDPQIDPRLPDTLNGLIAERVDALDPADRLHLQLAAVIGHRLSADLLRAALDHARPGPAEPRPDPRLDALLQAGLLQADREDDRWYGFASVLIWECVDHGISAALRRELHGLVAVGLERLHGSDLSSVVEAWAGHCHAAGRVREAARGMCEAAEQQRRDHALDRALERYQRAMAWLQSAPDRERDRGRDSALEARISLGAGEVAHLLGHPGAERFLQVALDIAAEEELSGLEARAMCAIGKIYVSKNQIKLARGYLEPALAASRSLRDDATRINTLWELGAAALIEGDTARARAAYEEGLQAAEADPGMLGWMLAGLAAEAIQRDDSGAADGFLQRAMSIAAGDRLLLGRLHNTAGIAHFQRRRYPEALAEFRRSLDLRRSIGFRWGEVINLHNIGDTLLSMDDPAGAWTAFEQSLTVARACAWERGIVMNELYLAYLRARQGEPAAPDLERQIARARRLGDPETAITGVWLLSRLRGSAELRRQAFEEARQAGFYSLAAQIEGEG